MVVNRRLSRSLRLFRWPFTPCEACETGEKPCMVFRSEIPTEVAPMDAPNKEGGWYEMRVKSCWCCAITSKNQCSFNDTPPTCLYYNVNSKRFGISMEPAVTSAALPFDPHGPNHSQKLKVDMDLDFDGIESCHDSSYDASSSATRPPSVRPYNNSYAPSKTCSSDESVDSDGGRSTSLEAATQLYGNGDKENGTTVSRGVDTYSTRHDEPDPSSVGEDQPSQQAQDDWTGSTRKRKLGTCTQQRIDLPDESSTRAS